MSLRVRLFLLFGGLVLLLGAAEWFLVRSLTSTLSFELGEVASSVGKRVFSFVTAFDGKLPQGHALKVPPPGEQPGAAVGALAVGKQDVLIVRRTHVSDDPGGKGLVTTEEETHTLGDGTKTWVSQMRVESGATDPDKRVPLTGMPQRVLVVKGPHISTEIPIPEKGFDQALGRFRGQLLLGSLGILGLGLLIAGFVAHRVTSPLRDLSRAARRVGAGELGARVEARAGGEVGEAIQAFNRMSGHLRELEAESLSLKESQHLGELGDVARGLAHALRNPLHAIGLTLDELAQRAGDSGPELAETARRQIRQVDASIRSFLALASGEGAAEEELDIHALVEEVALAAMQDARGRVSIAVEGEGARGRLRGVPAELKAAVQALVVNAVEASPDGSRVTVRVERSGELATVTVEDEGAGLPAEVRERLFLPHVTTKPSGSGMGLFLAHRIATTRYSGELTLRDRAPRGTQAVLGLRDRGPVRASPARIPSETADG